MQTGSIKILLKTFIPSTDKQNILTDSNDLYIMG